MSLLPLLLGGLAVLNPFIGLILMMIYCGLCLRYNTGNPGTSLLLFIVLPVVAATLSRQNTGILVMATDAVCGAGLASVLFVLALRRRQSLWAAFAQAAILIILYGVARYFVFGSYLSLANDQAVAELTRRLPGLYQNQNAAFALAATRYLWPASWTVPQLVALFLGFVLFQNLNGIRFDWKQVRLPGYYNLLILAVLPLYLVPALRPVFVNTLVALLVLPVIQGIGVLTSYLSSVIANKFILVLLMLVLISNFYLVALVGFADIWLDFRKTTIKGTTA